MPKTKSVGFRNKWNKSNAWCFSAVNLDRRESDKPRVKEDISFVGVGDSCIKL